MAAIHIGYKEIATGNADIVIAGGMGHMTRTPIPGAKGAIEINENLFTDKSYRHCDMTTSMNMGFTAEKLLAQTDFTREDMDQWAVRSHLLAAKAQEEGFFDDEIMPIDALQADGSMMTVKTEQSIRKNTTPERLASLKRAFLPEGSVTAGTSSPMNSGAPAMVFMSSTTAQKKGVTPLATIRSIGFAGVDPTIMGIGPVPASKKALKAAGLKVEDIDFWEINEAFCIVTLNCTRELGIDPDRANIMGGGVAIGHALGLGATGVRLVGTLARILGLKGGRYGLATACVGGGQGVATVIEKN